MLHRGTGPRDNATPTPAGQARARHRSGRVSSRSASPAPDRSLGGRAVPFVCLRRIAAGGPPKHWLLRAAAARIPCVELARPPPAEIQPPPYEPPRRSWPRAPERKHKVPGQDPE